MQKKAKKANFCQIAKMEKIIQNGQNWCVKFCEKRLLTDPKNGFNSIQFFEIRKKKPVSEPHHWSPIIQRRQHHQRCLLERGVTPVKLPPATSVLRCARFYPPQSPNPPGRQPSAFLPPACNPLPVCPPPATPCLPKAPPSPKELTLLQKKRNSLQGFWVSRSTPRMHGLRNCRRREPAFSCVGRLGGGPVQPGQHLLQVPVVPPAEAAPRRACLAGLRGHGGGDNFTGGGSTRCWGKLMVKCSSGEVRSTVVIPSL